MDIENEDEKSKEARQAQADKNAAIQAVFKSRVAGYFKQLTTGCGRTNCDNCFCMSNPGIRKYKLSTNESAILAVNLTLPSQKEGYMCPESGPQKNQVNTLEYMDTSKLVELEEEARKTDNFTPIIRSFGQIFDNPDSLTISFLKHPKQIKLDGTDTGLDLEGLRKFYEIVSELPENVQNVLASAYDRLLGALKYNNVATSHSRSSLRKYIIMLENTKLLDEKYSNRVTGALFRTIFQLPQPSQQFLRDNYIFHLDNKAINEFHHVIQDYIAVRILSGPDNLILNDDPGITSATKLLAWLYELNKMRKILTLTDFYNEMVNERINFKVDFTNWDKPSRAGKFTFCHYPYILNPETKSKILNIEAIISQRRKQEEAYQMLVQGLVEIPYFILKVRREHLIEDSVDTISVIKMTSPGDLKKQLRVQFAGEQGIDEGGVQKEWFQLVVEDLFSIKYGMFIQDNETHIQWFNHKSDDFREFELLGTVVGLAIYNGVILDLHFPLCVYKKLCGIKPTLEDFAEMNPGLSRGLKSLLEYKGSNLQEDMDLNFQVSFNYFGFVETQDLKPGGEDIAVTSENRQEYVDLYVKKLLEDSITSQYDAFKKGFFSVCDGKALKLFEPEELMLLVCGYPVLDFFELEKATSYDNGYDKDSPTIKMFWEVVHQLSEVQKKQLLFFATGSDRSPIGGLGKLNFVITRHGGDTDRLPTSHTCFNHLLLPEYGTKKKLERLLKKAITNSTGFGML